MANIPIERKKSMPWWVWLAALVVIVGVVWLAARLLNAPDEEGLALTEPTEMMSGAGGDTINEVIIIIDAPEKSTLVGRPVEITNAHVTSVPGDSTFFVGPENGNPDQRVLVVLDEQIPSSPQGVEGRYDVTQGQTVTIFGTVHQLSGGNPDQWGLSGQDAEKIQNDRIYIRADRLEITERPDGAAGTNNAR